jgi:outer membrane receptor protein involved in Fe transport
MVIPFVFFATAQAQETLKSGEQAGYEVFDLGEIFVTAEKYPAVRDVAVTTVITEEEIKATNSRTVAEVLTHVPGMRVSTGYKNEPDIQIRGFSQNRNIVLIDGVPYYETNYGKLDLNQIPVDNIAKIEITKGGSSVLYGPNALGGVINIITRKPSEKPSFEGFMEIGDYATYKFSFSNGMKKGIFNYWLNYTHQESNGWRMSDDYEPVPGTITRQGPEPPPPPPLEAVFEDGGVRNNSDYRSDSIWAKVGIEPEGGEYFLNFHYIDKEKAYPPHVSAVRVITFRPAFSHFAELPKYADWGLDLSGQQKIIDELTLKAKLFYHNHMDDFESYSDYNFNNKIAISRFKDYIIGGSLAADFRPVKWDILRAVFQYRKDSHEQRDDDYLPFEERLSLSGSVALENEFNKIKNLSVVIGASYDWFEVTEAKKNITDKNTGDFIRQDDLDTPDTMNEFNPMIGLTYTISDSTRLFGSVARKVRFPTLFYLYASRGGNLDLEAERSINYTLGVSHSFSSYARGELAFFYHDVDDFIARATPDRDAPYENFAKVGLSGFELTGEVNPAKDLMLRAGYTYISARDRSPDRVTTDFVNVPEHKVDVGVYYTIPYIMTRLDLTGLYMGKVYSQLPTPSNPTTEEIEIDDYYIMNARVSKSFAKYFEGYVAFNNIFDENYESETGFPAPGRSFYVGLAARF